VDQALEHAQYHYEFGPPIGLYQTIKVRQQGDKTHHFRLQTLHTSPHLLEFALDRS
jgi:hypothetical protein